MTLLRHRADLQTAAYMLAASIIPAAHWLQDGFNAWLLAAGITMAFAVSAMHHNHAHVPIWTSPVFNSLTDLWFTFFQGHPGYAFAPLHVDNHHRHHNSGRDLTRTWLYGDHNDLPGLLLHPFVFMSGALSRITGYLSLTLKSDRRRFSAIVIHYGLLIGADAVLLWIDSRKAFYCILAPQAAALFFLLASNYLQHAHAEGESEFNHSRNFLGLINPLFFNVGYHTAHHHAPELHWSRLPELHHAISPRIATGLNERSFAWYCLRVFVLAAVCREFRSRSMQSAMELPQHRMDIP